MYLKKLELFGFKSFANKTELVFEPAITTIVGPNGCGKSNISDSIKWVLGEQSAKELRGSKMEDVIFNGTDDTQPVNLAEVSLLFSNKDRILPVDYDEVIITRRVFRSGESEYLLNKSQVRLKDIMDLLAGTGIGVSSYSIAEQGKMDRVLNARPEDRREIFEEASGITKYKTRRKEALLKLEHTEQNLTRIADIINEVKRQIGSIERQAHKAEKFRLEFEKLKELDVKASLYEYNKVKEDGESVKQNNETLRQKEGHLSLELSLQQDELRIHREKTASLDEKISDTKQRASGIYNNIDKNENEVRLSKERTEELARRSESLNKEIVDISRRVTEITGKINSVESEFRLINDERENKQAFLCEAENNLSDIVLTIKRCEEAISKSKLTIMDNASSQSRLKNDLNKLSASLATSSSRHRRLNIEKENIAKELDSIQNQLAAAEAIFKEQRSALDNVLDQLNSFKDAYQQLSTNSKEKSSLIERLKQRLASSNSKLEVLKDLKEKKEGFSEGVKAYMEFIDANAEARQFFIGIIADMIDVKDGFVTAVESALGEKSQTIVVKTQAAAKDALEFLKTRKRGRAQFVAIDELPAASAEPVDFKHPSVIGRLADFVKTEDQYKRLLTYMLKDTYLVQDITIDSALRKNGNTFVTKDGYVSDGVIISGGSGSKEEYASIIGRDAKIRELTKEAQALAKEIRDYEAEYEQMVTRLGQIEKELTVLEESAKNEEIKLNAKLADKEKIIEQKQKLQQELTLIDLELEEISEEEASLEKREGSLKEELLKIESEREELESLINESQSTIAQKLSEKEKGIEKLAELRTQVSLINDKYNSQNETINMLKDSLKNEESAVGLRKEQFEESSSKISSLDSQIARLIEENKVLKNQSQIINDELLTFQSERKSAYLLIEDMDKKVRHSQKELDELRNNISTFHININELNYKAAGLKERIQATYKLNLDEQHCIFSGSEDWAKISEEIKQLKEKIEALGPVNLVAIEEHKELQDRYEFLTSQQQDLLSAKESLHKAINKINRTTRQMFLETFEQIKVAFKDYFKLLFGGGSAELFLIDQADILESGIEIVVRPPGKKLQSISLLSGGEKALTSVALLFALFKVRPTPFCILDEIDAPLDEANIDRFSRILQEFVKTTQFIIITHNKKTIAVSDIMYGITMEKSGISKIVSVKFAEDKKKEPQTVRLQQPQQTEIADEPQATEPVTDTNSPA